MGLGHERYDHPDYPGKTSGMYCEMAARGFYRRWADFLTLDTWSEIEAARTGRIAVGGGQRVR
jgi:hypothetical protein